MVTGQPLMPVTKDRQARMAARRGTGRGGHAAQERPGAGPPAGAACGCSARWWRSTRARFQTPTQLVEAIQACRAELAGQDPNGRPAPASPAAPQTLFVVETNEKLQDAFREKFKAQGYRVLLTIDAEQAVKRYQQTPYHALMVDAGTSGKDGVDTYKRVLREAESASWTWPRS